MKFCGKIDGNVERMERKFVARAEGGLKDDVNRLCVGVGGDLWMEVVMGEVCGEA
jgi:hypothetical protein